MTHAINATFRGNNISYECDFNSGDCTNNLIEETNRYGKTQKYVNVSFDFYAEVLPPKWPGNLRVIQTPDTYDPIGEGIIFNIQTNVEGYWDKEYTRLSGTGFWSEERIRGEFSLDGGQGWHGITFQGGMQNANFKIWMGELAKDNNSCLHPDCYLYGYCKGMVLYTQIDFQHTGSSSGGANFDCTGDHQYQYGTGFETWGLRHDETPNDPIWYCEEVPGDVVAGRHFNHGGIGAYTHVDQNNSWPWGAFGADCIPGSIPPNPGAFPAIYGDDWDWLIHDPDACESYRENVPGNNIFSYTYNDSNNVQCDPPFGMSCGSLEVEAASNFASLGRITNIVPIENPWP